MKEYPESNDKLAGLEEYVGYGHKTNNTQRDTHKHKQVHTHIWYF